MISLTSTRYAARRNRGPAWQQNPLTALLRNPAEIACLVRRIHSGERISDIAASLGITADHLRKRICKAGLSVVRREGTARQRVRERLRERMEHEPRTI